MKYFLSFLAITLTISFSGNLNAQSRWQSSGHMEVLVPNSEMLDNLNGTISFVGRWQVLRKIPKLPVLLGGEIFCGSLGSHYGNVYVDEFNTVPAHLKNEYVGMNAVARIQVPSGTVRPYLEGRAGFRYFYTLLEMNDPNAPQEPCPKNGPPVQKLSSDGTLMYSYGGGILVQLAELSNPNQGVFVDFNVAKIVGSEAGYMTSDFVTLYRSSTDMVQAGLGLTVKF